MAVIYLEIDDEITTAIARLRALTDGEAVVIVPPGSRIATSRINFKLLAREAHERRINVAAVSDDPAVRALAISAGLPTYDAQPAAEQALANFREQDRQLAERLARGADDAAPPWSSSSSTVTREMPGVVEASPIDGRPARRLSEATETQVLPVIDESTEPDRPERRRRRRQVPAAPLLVVGLLTLLLAGVAYGAYFLLPTAAITLTPQTTQLRLDSFTVIADPNVAVVDAGAGTMPAQPIALPLHSTGTFDATGVVAHTENASGSVRFSSQNTANTVDIPQGTVVSTADGVAFETTEAATVPKADFSTHTEGKVTVPVRAARPGPRGNVARDTITGLPNTLKSQLVSVTNPSATSGGVRFETLKITQADYDAAVAALTVQLDAALVAALADPAAIPRGLSAYPETASRATPVADQPANTLVGRDANTFTLALDSAGRVLAVNEALIDEIARTRLHDAVGPGQQAVGDQPSISHGPGVVADQFISYEVSASTQVYSAPDGATLVGLVRGKTVAEARAILAQYGMVEIVMWPDFVDRLPDQTSRISLIVAAPSAGS